MPGRSSTPFNTFSAARPRDKLESIPRLRRGPELSLAHQGQRRRRLLDRLRRPRRRADALFVARARLRPGHGWGTDSAAGPHGRACRRRRNGRGQHLRGPARGLEARPPQPLVGRRLQPPEPRRRRPRGPVGAIRRRSSATSAGTSSSSATGRCTRPLSPSPAARRSAAGSRTARTSSTPRSTSRAARPGASASSTTSATRARSRALLERRSDDELGRADGATSAATISPPLLDGFRSGVVSTTGRRCSSPTPSRASACRSPATRTTMRG